MLRDEGSARSLVPRTDGQFRIRQRYPNPGGHVAMLVRSRPSSDILGSSFLAQGRPSRMPFDLESQPVSGSRCKPCHRTGGRACSAPNLWRPLTTALYAAVQPTSLLGFSERPQQRLDCGKTSLQQLLAEGCTPLGQVKRNGPLVAALTTLDQAIRNKPIHEADRPRDGTGRGCAAVGRWMGRSRIQ